MEITEYFVAWGTYLAACSLLIMIGWSWTRRWWTLLRDITRLVVVALMLTPVVHENDTALMVPAVAVVVVGWVTGEDAALLHALAILLISTGLAVVTAVAVSIYERRKKRSVVSASDSESGPAGNCAENEQNVALSSNNIPVQE